MSLAEAIVTHLQANAAALGIDPMAITTEALSQESKVTRPALFTEQADGAARIGRAVSVYVATRVPVGSEHDSEEQIVHAGCYGPHDDLGQAEDLAQRVFVALNRQQIAGYYLIWRGDAALRENDRFEPHEWYVLPRFGAVGLRGSN